MQQMQEEKLECGRAVGAQLPAAGSSPSSCAVPGSSSSCWAASHVQPPSELGLRPAVCRHTLNSRSVAVGGLPAASGDSLRSTCS